MIAKKVTSGEVAAFLKDRACHSAYDKVPIYYGDLAKHFGFEPPTAAWAAHPFCNIFDEIDTADFKNGRPFLTALVISKVHNIPGPSFFKTLARLNPQKPVPSSEHARTKLYISELRKLLNHYHKTIQSI